ncbi:mRNA interferase HigB [compost metagenome]
MFNIITRRTLIEYYNLYPEAKNALIEWYNELIKADFNNFNELKIVFGNAGIVADNRVIFNIMGNKYRLIVRIAFEFRAIQIKWFGTHKEYNEIDVAKVNYIRK